jgi:hypothetical protein
MNFCKNSCGAFVNPSRDDCGPPPLHFTKLFKKMVSAHFHSTDKVTGFSDDTQVSLQSGNGDFSSIFSNFSFLERGQKSNVFVHFLATFFILEKGAKNGKKVRLLP